MNFPQYRRYKNRKSYFKIISNQEFFEYRLNINKIEKTYKKVSILPDRILLNDMLYNYEPYWEVANAEDLRTFLGNNHFKDS